MYNKKSIVAVILFFTLTLGGCNKWKDHTALVQQDLSFNLLQAIASNPELSKFREYIGKAGLDSVFKSSKSLTVWAPSNAALWSIDPVILANPGNLRALILNHISNQQYFTKDAVLPVRIQMLSGKFNNFSSLKFDEARIETADRYVSNGVLHTINTMVLPLQNIWEYINATKAQYAQNAFVASLNYNGFDASLATIDSISAISGLPIYTPGTGLVPKNYFTDRVADLTREDKQFTYFLVQDANLKIEADSLKNYFSAATTTITDSLTRWNVVKDFAFETAWKSATDIPLTLVSKWGVNMAVNTSFIVDVKKLSNGYVYILSKLDVPTRNEFLPITMQGENPSGFINNDKRGNTNYRNRKNPVSNVNFSDIMVSGHAVTTFYSFYRANETPSIKYQVYALATNDFQAAAFSQTINAWNTTLGALQGTLTHAVPLFTAVGAYNEMYLGDITNTKYGTIDWRLTSVTTGPIVLDYIRLVPVP